MTPAEIVKALREDCKTCSENSICLNDFNSAELHCANKDAADLIERLEKEKAVTQWISTTERLPEECVPVLINYIGHDGTMHPDGVAAWTGAAFLWWEGGLEDCDEEVSVTVTHWMPLPETPEEGEGT